MINLFGIVFQGIMARMAGGGLGAHHLDKFKITWLPELIFSIPFGVAFGYATTLLNIPEYSSIGLGILGMAWTYIWMQSATAPGIHWGKGAYNPNRTSTLKPFVDFLNTMSIRKWKIGPRYDPSTAAYCRLYMGVKGFLIGLPVGGFPLAILWPLSYEIGNRFNSHALAEFLSGIGAGIAIAIFVGVLF